MYFRTFGGVFRGYVRAHISCMSRMHTRMYVFVLYLAYASQLKPVGCIHPPVYRRQSACACEHAFFRVRGVVFEQVYVPNETWADKKFATTCVLETPRQRS